MKVYRLFFLICSCYYSFGMDSDTLDETKRKKAIVECANFHLESCEFLLNSGIPSVQQCNVRTECEFSGWLYAQVQNYTQSLPYLQKACNNNHIEGCNKLGFSYQRLNNYKKAKKYYKLACERNNMGGCFNLAMLYYDGLGVRHSYEMANILYKKVCEKHEGIGCLHLGLAYYNGNGVFKNRETATRYLQKACELGNNQACNLHDEYTYEKDVSQDEELHKEQATE
ncbi:sel1 repeat family protein [Helicobacter didelphidarum]|uniref:Beta-lactamase n=1 Tax=Helicobacter didelphidarum TaxID=2040648 RepID=A0A3D8ISM2_9HELI|nr:tetratricopeptide repeat protein [Helicobacter didelphidarum]RDU67634.1 sel1 repeat family protein [Helicobacter didelphidarum]